IRKHIAASAERNHLAHDLPAIHGVERAVADLQKYADHLAPAVLLSQRRHVAFKAACGALRGLLAAGNSADLAYTLGDVLDVAGTNGLDVEMQRLQALHHCPWRARLPGEDHVGSHRDDALVVHPEGIPDAGNRSCSFGVIAVLDRTHDAFAGPR